MTTKYGNVFAASGKIYVELDGGAILLTLALCREPKVLAFLEGTPVEILRGWR
jgi:hypothetical protein